MAIFDFDDGDFIFPLSKESNMGIDSNGDLHMRMGSNMSMDMDSGDLHITSGWNNHDDEDDYF